MPHFPKECHPPSDQGGIMNGSNTYSERQKVKNRAEFLFEYYCAEMDYQITRVGFDEKNGNVDNFYYLNPILRNLPDYVVNTTNGTWVVMVKGTANIKQKEIDLLPKLIECFHSEQAKLIYAFCFLGKKPMLIFPQKVESLYRNATDKQWQDGVVYRSLEIEV
jgi:hypothetical protein